MFKEVQLSEIEINGFLHSRVNQFIFDNDKKKLFYILIMPT